MQYASSSKEDEGIVYTLSDERLLCVRQFGPYPP